MSNERCGSGYFFFNRTPTAEALRSFAEHVLVKADPVRSDLALNFRNVELPGAGQVAQFPFELVFSFGVPIRLDRGAMVRSGQVAIERQVLFDHRCAKRNRSDRNAFATSFPMKQTNC